MICPLAAAALLFPGGASAAPGEVDSGFAKDGVAAIDLPVETRMTLLDFRRLPDGRMLLAGGGRGEGDGLVVRVLADGTPDPEFGTGGFVVVPGSSWNRLVPTASGDLVAFGRVGDEPAVLRLGADGRPDPGFGIGGIVSVGIRGHLDIGEKDNVTVEFDAGTVTPEGKLVATSSSNRCARQDDDSLGDPGDESCRDVVIVRLNADGTPDSSLGGDGMVIVGTGFGYYDNQATVEVDEDGTVVVANTEDHTGDYEYEPNTFFWVTRFNQDGSRMKSFGGDGKVLYSYRQIGMRTGWYNVESIHFLRSGGLVLTAGPQIMRLTETGKLDRGFYPRGVRTLEETDYRTNTDMSAEASRSALGANEQRIYFGMVGRTFGKYNGRVRGVIGVTRTGRAGLPDPTFSSDGTGSEIVDFKAPFNTEFWTDHLEAAIPVVLRDGRIRVAATTRRSGRIRFVIVQFQGGAAPRLRCQGKPATVQGTNGDDVLKAGKVTVAGDGDDVINVNDGSLVCAGKGDDSLRPGSNPARGTFFAGSGDDQIEKGMDGRAYGGGGNDVIRAGAYLEPFGGPGDDQIDAGRGAQVLVGGEGNDILKGGDGDDRLLGDGGRDRLFGEEGTDELIGGSGQDQLRVGPMGPRYHRYRYKGHGLDMDLKVLNNRFMVWSRIEYKVRCRKGKGFSEGSGPAFYRSRINPRTGLFTYSDSFTDDYWATWTEKAKGRVTDREIFINYLYRHEDEDDPSEKRICQTGYIKDPWIRIRARRVADPRQVARQ